MTTKIFVIILISTIPQIILLIFCIRIFIKHKRVRNKNNRIYDFSLYMNKPIAPDSTNLSGNSDHPISSENGLPEKESQDIPGLIVSKSWRFR